MKLCSDLLPLMGVDPETSPLYPILGNPLFPPGTEDTAFWHLLNGGYSQASCYVKEGRWLTIPEMTIQSGVCKLRFSNTLQITHFLNTLSVPGLFTSPPTIFEKYCSETEAMSHTLSANYELLTRPARNYSLNFFGEWEQNLGKPFNIIQRQRILRRTHKSLICAKTQETNFKSLSCWYRTPEN